MATKPMTILGVPGSLREHSFNKALIRAASEVAPEGIEIPMFLLHEIPLYNADVEAQGIPEPVRKLKQAIAEADGLLISTPQYNASVPGVLKNAIDWASRPSFESVLAGKPVAVLGATSGRSATEKGRAELMNVLRATRSEVMEDVTIGISNSADYIEEGVVESDEVKAQIRRLLDEFVEFIRRQELAEAAD